MRGRLNVLGTTRRAQLRLRLLAMGLKRPDVTAALSHFNMTRKEFAERLIERLRRLPKKGRSD